MSETIPNYSLDENHEKYMDALVNLARLEDKYHIPAGQRFTVYKDVDGQVYPFENSDNYPPNTDSLSNEYRHHVVQLYEKSAKLTKNYPQYMPQSSNRLGHHLKEVLNRNGHPPVMKSNSFPVMRKNLRFQRIKE